MLYKTYCKPSVFVLSIGKCAPSTTWFVTTSRVYNSEYTTEWSNHTPSVTTRASMRSRMVYEVVEQTEDPVYVDMEDILWVQ